MARRSYSDDLSMLENDRYFQTYYDEETSTWVDRTSTGKTREELLVEYQENANRLNAISGVYQRADRIISGDEVEVNIVNDPDMDTQAQNDGKVITFNANLIEDLDSDTILSLHGLNYHELAHLLYSPRQGSDLGKYCKDNKTVRALQMLEEARVETLIANKYPVTKLFLEASLTAYVLKTNPNEWGHHFAVVTGRKYLPLELRQVVADKFIAMYGTDLAQEVHSIIHSYRSLVFPTDFDKAKELVVRMANLIGYDNEDNKKPMWGGHGEGTPMLSRGRPENAKEQARLQDKDKSNANPTEKVEASTGVGGEDGTYDGEDKDFTEQDKVIAEKLTERVSQIKRDEFVQREVKETRKAIANSDEMRTAMKPATFYDQLPSSTAISLARRFGTELERIVRDNDPAWNRFLPSGKLNISRSMNPDINAIDKMFDVWDTGNDKTDIEAVILMDNSSSMGGTMRSVSENAWIIKRGIESIQGSVTVYTFNHESKLVYAKEEKAKAKAYRYMQASGSTNPIRGLIEAERLLTTSKKSLKLAFIITDGEWESAEECDSIIKSLNDKGIVTCVVYIGNYDYVHNLIAQSKEGDEVSTRLLKGINHKAKIFKAVADSKDVLKLATTLVKEMLTPTRRK